MATNALAAASGASTYSPTTSQTKEFTTEMDKDAFLNLLVTQLKNQNPLQPMQDTEFISQMAQFSSLEQAQNTNKAITINSASNMVNKIATADYKETDTSISQDIVGLVEKMTIKSGKVYLTLNVSGEKKDVKFEDIKDVTELENTTAQIYQMNQSTGMSYANSLMNKLITGKTTSSEDVTGTVTGVKMKSGLISLVVGSKDVLLDSITAIN